MSKYANRLTRNLVPYMPGEQPKEQGLIKLNTNENPFPPGPLVKKALADFRPETLRLYPDPESTDLCAALAKSRGTEPEQVFVGNGSDEVLAFIFQAFFEPEGEPLLTPDKTYSFYEVYAKRYGIPYETAALAKDQEIKIEDYARPSQAVILANPNAPTGRLVELPDLVTLLEQDRDRLVVIDEAYIDFAPAGSTALPLLSIYDNLLVVQTFSKSHSLAGLRVGMAFGSEELISDLKTIKNTFNSYPLDRLAGSLAQAALREPGYYRHTCAAIRQIREETSRNLQDLGFVVTPSEANFLWVKHPDISGERLFHKLRSARILVRRWDRADLKEFLRISIGSAEEMQIFNRTITNIVAEDSPVSL